MRMVFKVKYADGHEVEAVAKPRDVIDFERKYGTSFGQFGSAATPVEWLYFMAWSPLHRTSKDTRAFEAFIDDLDEIEVLDEETPVPFDPAPSDGSSQGSPSTSE